MHHITAPIMAVGYACTGLLSASETNTLHVTYHSPKETFMVRLQHELDPAGIRIGYDQLGPPSHFERLTTWSSSGYGVHEYYASRGRDIIFDTFKSAAREAAVDTLPLEEYRHACTIWGGTLLDNIIRGSIGNTAEEQTEIISATPSYMTLRHLDEAEEHGTHTIWTGHYGIRPWRDKPYIYTINDFGHYEGRQFIHTEVRCSGYIFENFGLIKVESQAIITLGKKTQFVLGSSLYPTDMNSTEHRPSASGRWETRMYAGILSIGMTTSPVENFYSISWWRTF